MRLGILGGTGNMGRGLTIRWALKHDILIGSRSLNRAQEVGREQENIAKGFHQTNFKGSIKGVLNSDAVKKSEVVVVTLPSEAIVHTLTELKQYLQPNQVIVSTAVSMKKIEGLFHYTPVSGEATGPHQGKSAAEVIQEIVKPTPVVTAFQTVPAAYLNNIDSVMNIDVLIAGNHDAAIELVSRLICDIPNLRRFT